MHGTSYPLVETLMAYPVIRQLLPLHPWCRMLVQLIRIVGKWAGKYLDVVFPYHAR